MDVNLAANAGATPLSIALAEGHAEVVQMLRAAGASETIYGNIMKLKYGNIN